MEAVASMTFETGVQTFLRLLQQEIERQNAPLKKEIEQLKANQQPPAMVGTKETMKILGVNKNTITRYVKNGKLTPAGEGRPMMFYKKQVEELKESLKKEE